MSCPPPDPPPTEEDPVDALLEEFLARELQGERPDFEQFVAEHPEHAERLRQEICGWEVVAGLLDQLGEGMPPAEVARLISSSDRRASTAIDVPYLRETLASLQARSNAYSRFVIKGEIGRGGMGQVMRVYDEDLRRSLALKVIAQDSRAGSSTSSSVDPRRLGRFLEEAQITAQLDHPGIVPVHELGLTADGRIYFTMKLVQGRDFGEILKLARAGQEGFHLTRAVGILRQVCEAMAYAHHKGVVHRDLKPSNVMVGAWGEVYVMDWGLARVLDRADTSHRPTTQDSASAIFSARANLRESDTDSPLHTTAGTVIGTPAYMPPEQAAGQIEDLGKHSDIYAVGAMLYHLLVGHPPYLHESPLTRLQLLARIQAGPPPTASALRKEVQPELSAICEFAMAHAPGERYPSMQALAEDLRAFLEGRVVGAYETGVVAEVKKWLLRNRLLAGTILLATLLLVGGFAAASLVLAGKNQALSSANDGLARQGYEAAIAATEGSLLTGDVASAERYLRRAYGFAKGFEWYYLASLADASERTLYGHAAPLRSLAIAPSGEHIYSFDDQGVLCQWEFASGQMRSRLALPLQPWPHEVSISPSTKFLAALDTTQSQARSVLCIYELSSGSIVARQELEEGEAPPFAFSPDDRWFVSGGRELRLRDSERHSLLWRVSPSADIAALRFAPDGKLLAVRTKDGRLELRETASGALFRSEAMPANLRGHALSFRPDGRWLAMTSSGNAILVWDVLAEQLVTTLTGTTAAIRSLDFAPDGKSLLSSHEDGRLRLWDLDELGHFRDLLGHQYTPQAVFHPAGTKLVSAALDRTVKVWNVPSRERPLPRQADTGSLRITAAHDGSLAALRNSQSVYEMRDLRTGHLLWQRAGDPAHYPRLAFRADGTTVALPSGNGVLLLGARSGQVRALAELGSDEEVAYDLLFQPTTGELACVTNTGHLRLFSGEDGGRVASIALGVGALRCLAFDAAGARLACAGDAGKVIICSYPELKILETLECGASAIWDVRWLAGGKRLTTVARQGGDTWEVYLWHLDGGSPRSTRIGSYLGWGRVEVVAHPAGDRFVLSHVQEKRMSIFAADLGTEIYALRNFHGANYGVLGFFGGRHERLLTYDDHGLLVEFDMALGFRHAQDLAATPQAERIMQQIIEQELYLENILAQLAVREHESAALGRTLPKLALERAPTRAGLLRELELGLCRATRTEPSFDRLRQRVERLAQLDGTDATSLCLLALLRCREQAWQEARALALAAGAAAGTTSPWLAAVLALAHYELDEYEAGRAQHALLTAHTQEGWWNAASGAGLLLAEVEQSAQRAAARAGRAAQH